jgi:hypothetical protein
VVIFPVVKRVNESVALGYVAARTVESVLILVAERHPAAQGGVSIAR